MASQTPGSRSDIPRPSTRHFELQRHQPFLRASVWPPPRWSSALKQTHQCAILKQDRLLDQRVVDLKVRQVLDPRPRKVVNSPSGQSTQRATVAIRIERNGIRGSQQHFTGFAINRRHDTLGEKMHRAGVQPNGGAARKRQPLIRDSMGSS